MVIENINECERLVEIEENGKPISAKTIWAWYCTYNIQGYFNNCKQPNGKVPLPLFLDSNPDVEDTIVLFCNGNLAILTTELLHEYISEKCLPALLKNAKMKQDNMSISDILKENDLPKLSLKTVKYLDEYFGAQILLAKKSL